MKKSIFIFCLVFIQFTFAQVNIEKYNMLQSNEKLAGNIGFYISSKTGNTDIQEFELDSRLNYSGDSFYTFLIANGEYGWNKGVEYSNSALIHLRYIHKMNDTFNPEIFTQVNYNKKLLVLFRSLLGTGLRTTVIADSVSSLNFGTAYMFEYEDLDLSNNAVHPNETKRHIWSNYISYSGQLTRNSRISVVVYAQPRFDDISDLRILSENHIGVNLTDRLSLSVNFSLRYDSKPPDGVKDLDTNTKVGLSIKL